MGDDPRRRQAVGVDFGRHLPGLFWWNFFGPPYQRLLGERRLAAAPGLHVSSVNSGTVIQLAERPQGWDTPEYAVVEQRVLDHLGPELFFAKAHPDRVGVVPACFVRYRVRADRSDNNRPFQLAFDARATANAESAWASIPQALTRSAGSQRVGAARSKSGYRVTPALP